MWRYRELLPLRSAAVTLGEIETPLLHLDRLSDRFNADVYLKDESPLPTSTFKARGAAMGVSMAAELGVKRIVMPTAGNAGGAWAMYAARAGIPIAVVIPATATEANKTEVSIAGGELIEVEGDLADAGIRAKEIAEGLFLASTFAEPYRVEGKKTAWLETFDQLGDGDSMKFPGTIITPVGGGVAVVAASQAADQVLEAGWATGDKPVIVGVQPEGCAPIARAFELGAGQVQVWDEPIDTIAMGLRVPAPGEGRLVLDRIRTSRGRMLTVSEDEIREFVKVLASTEGIFACPEGAAAVAATARLASELPSPIVIYNTGSGAKYASLI